MPDSNIAKNKAYFKVALISERRGYPFKLLCRKCNLYADYVQVNDSPCSSGGFYCDFGSSYCERHVGAVAKKRRMRVLNTWDELDALIEAMNAERTEQQERWRQQERERYEMEIRYSGKVLRLTGHDGRMFELPDRSLVCIMADGREIRPCCWNNGLHMIRHDPRHTGDIPEHGPDCKKGQDTA